MIQRLRQYVPALQWLPGYRRAFLSGDLSAGLTVGIMLIPQGMAYAMLAGLPPIYGLYASLIPLIAYAIFGTSRQLSVGPVAMDSLLVAIGVAKLAEYGSDQFISMAILLATLVGAIQLILGLLRMGFLANFLSYPVISGFTSAAAIIIGLSQLPHFLGIPSARGNQLHVVIGELLPSVAGAQLWPIVIGLGGLFIILASRKIHKAIPGALLAVGIGIAVVYFGNLGETGLKVVGTIPSGFPTFHAPDIHFSAMMDLLPTALTIALVGFMEAFSVAKAMQARHKDYQISANQELIGLGMANLTGSLFQAFPVTGGFSRTAVNDQAGARTALSGVFSALVVLAVLLFLTDWFYYLPHAILASIVWVAVFGLIDFKQVRYLWRTNRRDLAMLVATFLATLFLGIQEGIGIGVGLSLIMVVYETSYPHYAILGRLPGSDVFRNVKRFPEAEQIPGVLLIRFDAKIYFGNTSVFESVIREEASKRPDLKLIIINAEAINTLDSSAAQMLHTLTDDLRKEGIDLAFTAVKGPVRDVMLKCGIVDHLGKGHFFETLSDAVAHFDGNQLSQREQVRFQTDV